MKYHSGSNPAATWDRSVAEHGAIWSAAGATSRDPFVKFPSWFWPHLPSVGTIVDVGCGYGRVAIPILRNRPGVRLIGFDASEQMLDHFRGLAREHGVSDRAELRHSAFPPIDLPDASADLVITSAVLLHNPFAAAREIVAEIHRVLKPGRKALFSASFVARWNAEGLQNFVAQAVWPPLRRKNGPVRTYTRRMVRDVLRPFEHVEIFTTHATVLPRTIYRWTVPGGDAIRALNAWAEQHEFTRNLFAREFEAIAIKGT